LTGFLFYNNSQTPLKNNIFEKREIWSHSTVQLSVKHLARIPRVASCRAEKLLINSYITSESARSGSRPRRVRHFIIIVIYWTWVQSPRLRVVWDFSIETMPRRFSIAMTTAPSTAIATALQDEISLMSIPILFLFFFWPSNFFALFFQYFTLQIKKNIVSVYNRILWVCIPLGIGYNTYNKRHYQKVYICLVQYYNVSGIIHLYRADSNNIK